MRCLRASLRPSFLSTLSLRRATRHWQTGQSRTRHFYPRSPCGERLIIIMKSIKKSIFLSTLSLRRATAGSLAEVAKYATFLSTLSLRRATVFGLLLLILTHSISIHALLAESDQAAQGLAIHVCEFLSTLSLRRATLCTRTSSFRSQYFYPRSPCGERLQWFGRSFLNIEISIHALLAESDEISTAIAAGRIHFYPRSPCGERPRKPVLYWAPPNFYPRSPCGERLPTP